MDKNNIVELIDYMGSDASVVNAARVSFAKSSSNYTLEQNENLIRYLAAHGHWTPFAHTAVTLRVKAPVPIRTQIFKHKIGFCENEESRRYIAYTPEIYVPSSFREAPTGGAKQGSGGDHPDSDKWLAAYTSKASECVELYLEMIHGGVCPEQARFILPQGTNVHWIWTGNLYAFANFYHKRTDPHAQKEVRDVALEVGEIMKTLYPISWYYLTGVR